MSENGGRVLVVAGCIAQALIILASCNALLRNLVLYSTVPLLLAGLSGIAYHAARGTFPVVSTRALRYFIMVFLVFALVMGILLWLGNVAHCGPCAWSHSG